MSTVLLPWRIHLPTADQTCVRVVLRPRGERDPWPFSLALTALQRLGATAEARFRSLGAGRGEPLLASQELAWRGVPLLLETDRREAALSLPCWDELADSEATEEDFWELVDAFAAAVDAAHGALGDGEALGLEAPGDAAALRRALGAHHALLVGAGCDAPGAGWLAAAYRELPLSGLTVLLR